MKFTFKPSPNYRHPQSTTKIMGHLTVALGAVLLASIIWYGISFGMALRVAMLAVVAVVTAILTEIAFFAFTGSKDIRHDVTHSYGWVTALILVLITRIDVSYYAVVIATIVAILFGKLVFGGFGQNIFNPAALGEAIIMNSFSANGAEEVTAKVLSGATPMTAMGSAGWNASASVVENVITSYGGLFNMLMGDYVSVIGGSCAIVLIAAFFYLLYNDVIDWHLSVPYILTILVVSLITGFANGSGISFALFNILGGGVLFVAVFMVTDPVTSPVTIPGKYIFAVYAAALTLIIRWKAAIPDGALFALLLMNMLTPAIDRACSGSQIKDAKKIQTTSVVISLVAIVIAVAVGVTL